VIPAGLSLENDLSGAIGVLKQSSKDVGDFGGGEVGCGINNASNRYRVDSDSFGG
jgi:hypothetical protein